MTLCKDHLSGEKVRLRPLTELDAADHVRWRNDPEVRFWAVAGAPNLGPVTLAAVQRWFSESVLVMDPAVGAVLAVDSATDDRHIGMVDYRAVDNRARSAEVGITIGEKELWGNGYGTEALKLLTFHLLGPMNLRRLQLDTWSGNARAIRAFLKAGFREEGRLREAVRGPDGYYDSVIMGLLRSSS